MGFPSTGSVMYPITGYLGIPDVGSASCCYRKKLRFVCEKEIEIISWSIVEKLMIPIKILTHRDKKEAEQSREAQF